MTKRRGPSKDPSTIEGKGATDIGGGGGGGGGGPMKEGPEESLVDPRPTHQNGDNAGLVNINLKNYGGSGGLGVLDTTSPWSGNGTSTTRTFSATPGGSAVSYFTSAPLSASDTAFMTGDGLSANFASPTTTTTVNIRAVMDKDVTGPIPPKIFYSIAGDPTSVTGTGFEFASATNGYFYKDIPSVQLTPAQTVNLWMSLTGYGPTNPTLYNYVVTSTGTQTTYGYPAVRTETGSFSMQAGVKVSNATGGSLADHQGSLWREKSFQSLNWANGPYFPSQFS